MDGGDEKPTISFFADRLDLEKRDYGMSPPKFCELHLRWFERIPRHNSGNTLRLVLNANKEKSDNGRRQSFFSIMRRLSFSGASPTSPQSTLGIDFADLLYDFMYNPLVSPSHYRTPSALSSRSPDPSHSSPIPMQQTYPAASIRAASITSDRSDSIFMPLTPTHRTEHFSGKQQCS
ncbi:hypothetical protein K432DRAFT_73783 [Lepidopterella palustris CBS 459.81]|uniref:Uncharacterized protein n=1 Tax=Lepidopterella palustris CBS 459.81 TaxID=1314670 RepID=A0A8E2E8P3_9PEZI|nr:hypothetical protein K432DRAFT_73783 [Lepidopterella palustris CBS 459.81]